MQSFALSAPDARQLIDEIDRGSALPTQWFNDPAIYSAELSHIHRRAWHFATHTGELARPGEPGAANALTSMSSVLCGRWKFVSSASTTAKRAGGRRNDHSAAASQAPGRSGRVPSCRRADSFRPRGASPDSGGTMRGPCRALARPVWGNPPRRSSWRTAHPRCTAHGGSAARRGATSRQQRGWSWDGTPDMVPTRVSVQPSARSRASVLASQ